MDASCEDAQGQSPLAPAGQGGDDVQGQSLSQQQIRASFESGPTAMIMVNDRGNIVHVNAEALRIFGYTVGELTGQSIELLVPVRFRERHSQERVRFTERSAARPMGQHQELTALRSDGTEFPVEIGLNPIRTPEGVFIIAAVVDITQRQKSEKEIARKNQDLQTLLYIISHDLREPLRSIQQFSLMVKDRYAEKLDEKGSDFLTRIVNAADRMERLLKDITHLSRISRMDEPSDKVPMSQLVGEAIKMLQNRISESGASISVAEDLPTVVVNRAWATQAIFNLLSNALKFTRSGCAPEIEIRAFRSTDPEAGVVVCDRGLGIESEHAERIFTLFQRAVGREIEGTGAGLAIVREIANRHGGRAWATPREGGGSKFYITFGARES